MKNGFVFPGVHGEPINKKPGVYQGIPAAEYFAWNAISNSSMSAAVQRLNPLVVSMAHYRDQKPVKETPEIRFGKFCHADQFSFLTELKNYVVVPDLIHNDIDKRGELFESPCLTKEKKKHVIGDPIPDGWSVVLTDETTAYIYKITESPTAGMYQDRLSRFKALNVGKEFVDQDELERKAGLLYSLDNTPEARSLFANHGPATDYELSIVWKDPLTGLPCKARIDCVQHADRLVIDFKTTASVVDFPRKSADFGYHRQGAWYADGMTIITGESYRAAAVCGEAQRPFAIGAAPWNVPTMLAGRHQYRQVLNAIAQAIDADNWPSVPSPAEWAIPDYAMPNVAVA
ncbi:MAG: PD-(D/E)XK nuclease-like domain-containing protein [Planctomycetes bacterium]|nr:PD-(D/E)XK nuclease-like domain-containing protein [Planctomycetota bacterium]